MDIESEISRFYKDWEIDFTNRCVQRKPLTFLRKIGEFFVRPSYPVIAMYRFIQAQLDSDEGIEDPNFIVRNAGNDAAGIPTWFEISRDWFIPESDLKLLSIGPLVQGEETLVEAFPSNNAGDVFWMVMGKIATIGGVVSFIAWLLG